MRAYDTYAEATLPMTYALLETTTLLRRQNCEA
jgi:hypothetical protein